MPQQFWHDNILVKFQIDPRHVCVLTSDHFPITIIVFLNFQTRIIELH